jgi:hypothetical protein
MEAAWPRFVLGEQFELHQASISLICPRWKLNLVHLGWCLPLMATPIPQSCLAQQLMPRHEQVGESCQYLHLAAVLVAPPRSACGLGESMPRSWSSESRTAVPPQPLLVGVHCGAGVMAGLQFLSAPLDQAGRTGANRRGSRWGFRCGHAHPLGLSPQHSQPRLRRHAESTHQPQPARGTHYPWTNPLPTP